MKTKNFPGRKNLRQFGKKSVYNVPTIMVLQPFLSVTDTKFRIGRKNRNSTGLPWNKGDTGL